jgi:TRAP transporter TAXI family solute receptor
MWGGLRRPIGPFQVTCVLAATAFVAAFSISPTYAQNARNRWFPEKQNFGAAGERLNANTVTIVAGGPNGTYLSIANDLAAVLDDGEDFRVLPLIGKGAGQNLRDVRFLKGVDLGITQTNLLNAARRSNELGNLDGRIVYIAKLFSEEMHLLVRSDSGITSIEQLAGRTVNFGVVGGGTQFSARDVFGRLKIKIDEVNQDQDVAVAKLKSGQIAATVLIAGKPAPAIARLKADEGFRILPVPFAKPLQDDYLPAVLGNEDYPDMIAAGDGLETVAVGAVLIAYNWPRGSEPYRRLEDFVGRFFSRNSEFQQVPRHPKWREANMAAALPGWTRFQPAEDWLAHNRQMLTARTQFNEFLSSRMGTTAVGSQEERARLFLEFVKWNEGRTRR